MIGTLSLGINLALIQQIYQSYDNIYQIT